MEVKGSECEVNLTRDGGDAIRVLSKLQVESRIEEKDLRYTYRAELMWEWLLPDHVISTESKQ